MNSRNVLLLALVVSVSVNLVIAGVVIGHRGGPRGEPPPMLWAAQTLEPETRRLVRGQMRMQMPRVRPLRERVRRAHAAVQKAVMAENYDPEALGAALAELREAGGDYEAFVHANLVEMSAGLNEAQRRALVGAALQRSQGKMPQRPPKTQR